MTISPETLLITIFAAAIAPTALGALTCFLKVSIVLGALKNALGAQNFPGQFVIFALSAIITWIVMEPVFQDIRKNLLTVDNLQLNVKNISLLTEKLTPLKNFLLKNSGNDEISFFTERLQAEADSWRVAISSFVATEIREAFRLALMLYIPFFIIDFVTASVLVSAGMFMLSPMIISLPIKIALLVFAEPWLKLLDAFINSY